MTIKQPFPVFSEFHEIKGIYEPSAAEQMPDGRVFVVEDEMAHAVAILTIQGDGSFEVERPDAETFFTPILDKKNPRIPGDFEGIAVDNDGFVYAITSHSREKDGKVYPHREQFIRFRLDGSEPREMAAYGNLKADIAAAHPLLAESTAITDVKTAGGFNIEGLAFDRDERAMLIGFRSPQADGKAVLVRLENPRDLFERGARAVIGTEMILLDMKGDGVRGMAYDPRLEGFLIISGPTSRARSLDFGLWFWNGEAGNEPEPIEIPVPATVIRRGECVSPIHWNGNDLVLLIRDDGNKKKEKYAHYMFLTYDQIRTGSQ